MSSNLSLLQMVSDVSLQKNIEQVTELLDRLQPKPMQLVLLPENALCFAHREDYLLHAESLGNGPYQAKLAKLAKLHQCYLVCGSFPIRSENNDKIYTTSLVFSTTGELIQYYHKIHLFDAKVSDSTGCYQESATFIAGDSLKLFELKHQQGCVKVGLAICYDLRFPGLFQALREAGAEVILLPAAFTKVTGEAHWLTLLKARAIETQCYIVAANQGGLHQGDRETYGHSLIISPWGEILSELGEGLGVLEAAFDQQLINQVRDTMPVLAHNRFTHLLNN